MKPTANAIKFPSSKDTHTPSETNTPTSAAEPTENNIGPRAKKVTPARDSRGRLLPGHTANPKGRAPGSKNKRTSVRDALESIDFDFWEDWHSLYNDPETKNADRRGMLADILKYTHPQLKSVEVTQANPVPSITVHVVDAPENLNTSADLLDVIDAPDSTTASNT